MRGKIWDVPQGVLPEGPVYDPLTGYVFWVDIIMKRLYWRDFDQNGEVQFMEFEDATGFVALTDMPNTVLVGVGGAIIVFNWRTKDRKPLRVDINLPPEVRWNDSRPGPNGMLYAGLMDRKCEKPLGGLYLIHPDGSNIKLIPTATVANGMGWSVDKKRFWWTDSAAGEVFEFNYDLVSGRIDTGRSVFDLRPLKPKNATVFVPDGFCVDVKDKIWLGVYSDVGPGQALRLDPTTGKVLARIELPPKVTCPAFVGRFMDQMLVTTAQENMSARKLAEYPDSGKIYICKLRVPGQPANRFALSAA